MRSHLIPSLLLSTLGLIACGDDGGSTSVDATPLNCTVSSMAFGARGPLTGSSFYSATATAGVGDIRAVLPLEAAPPSDVFLVEFYTGFAPFGTAQAPTAVVPGTYPISGSQLQFADCGVCLRVLTNLAANGDYDDDYMATGGSVTVTASDARVGGNLTFTVANVQFEHVTINEMTFVSTPVGDGCGTSITSGNHTSVLAAPPAKLGAPLGATAGKRVR